MATSNYRSRFDQTTGENSGSTRPVHPSRPELQVQAGAENKTPAPVKRVAMNEKDPQRGYGNNHDATPSSILPGETVTAPFSAMAPVDTALDAIKQRGSRVPNSDDLKDVESNVPTHPAMAKRAPDSGSPGIQKFPEKNGSPTSDWDARRAAQLKEAK
jgi:hypothetical protein